MPTRVWGCPTTAHWTYRLRPERAKRLLLTGDRIDGVKAAARGLVSEAAPGSQLDATVDALAARIAGVPQGMLMMQKMVVNEAIERMGCWPVRLCRRCSTASRGITLKVCGFYVRARPMA